MAQMVKDHLQCRGPGFHRWVEKIPWRREWLPTSVLLPGESHRQSCLAGDSPQGRKELDTTEQRSTHAIYLIPTVTWHFICVDFKMELGLLFWYKLVHAHWQYRSWTSREIPNTSWKSLHSEKSTNTLCQFLSNHFPPAYIFLYTCFARICV